MSHKQKLYSLPSLPICMENVKPSIELSYLYYTISDVLLFKTKSFVIYLPQKKFPNKIEFIKTPFLSDMNF